MSAKKYGGGRGGEEKETLGDKPLHFENSRSPTNRVSDWRSSDFLIDTSQSLMQPRSQGLSSLPPLSLRKDPGSCRSRGTR